jgi:hypothetical protein
MEATFFDNEFADLEHLLGEAADNEEDLTSFTQPFAAVLSPAEKLAPSPFNRPAPSGLTVTLRRPNPKPKADDALPKVSSSNISNTAYPPFSNDDPLLPPIVSSPLKGPAAQRPEVPDECDPKPKSKSTSGKRDKRSAESSRHTAHKNAEPSGPIPEDSKNDI